MQIIGAVISEVKVSCRRRISLLWLLQSFTTFIYSMYDAHMRMIEYLPSELWVQISNPTKDSSFD